MNRRTFLSHSGKAAAAMSVRQMLPRLSSSAAFAQSPTGYKAIVYLLMDGGNDGNNMLIPADGLYLQYAAGRGPLALSKGSLNVMSPASSGRVFGAHPALSNVATLYNSGHAAWVANAGPLPMPLTRQQLQQGAATPFDLFSHPDQRAEWESASTSAAGLATGWGGRIADVMAAKYSATTPMVISTSGFSLMGAGAKTTAASLGMGTNSVEVLNELEALAPMIQQMESGNSANHLQKQISGMMANDFTTTYQLGQAFKAGATMKTVFPQTTIGQQLQTIAQMINGRSTTGATRQIFLCRDPGYDTHSDQLAQQGASLTGVDAAIGAFVQAMVEIGTFDQVTLFTMSDFARTFTPNSGGGADHAWGSHHFIVGGSVKGGDVYGTFPSLIPGGDDDLSTTGLWIPTTSCSQYAATFAKWLGVNAADSSSIFPELKNFTTSTLGFL